MSDKHIDIIDQLEQFYPGIKDDIEFIDVATPRSL
jgi:hypothetical protein